MIAGEAGVGKSRLLLEFRKELSKARVRVGSSQCREFAQRPYASILDALADLAPNAAPLAPAPSRDVQFDTIARGFRDMSKSRTIAVFVEDLHWADPASVEMLLTIARDAASSRMLIVATFRPEAIQENHPLYAGIARLQRLPNATALHLEPLGDRELRTLIDGALHAASADIPYDVRSAVARLSEGNPLFAEELLKTAVDRMHAGAASPVLPTTIRAAVLERLRPLDATAQAILAQAAVIGRRFSAELLEATVGESRPRILEALRHARGLQLIQEEGAGDFTFHHALTREAIYESFLAAQVRGFHARIAATIEALPEGRRALQELAYHWWAAADGEKALVYGEQAGDAAMAFYAYDEAARLYGYSLDHLDPQSRRAGDLLMKIGFAHGRNGSKAIAVTKFRAAMLVFRGLGALEDEVHACAEMAAGLYSTRAGNSTEELEALRTRLGAPDHRRLRAWVDVTIAQHYTVAGIGDPAALLDGAEDAIIDTDDPRQLTVYYATRATLAARTSDAGAYLANAERASATARRVGMPSYEATVLSNAAMSLSDLGRFADADRYFERALAHAREHKFLASVAYVLATRARRRLLGGLLAQARADVLEALGVTTDYDLVRPFTTGVGTALGLLLDDQSLIEQCFDPSQIGRGNPLQIAASYADRLFSLGRDDEARALLVDALSYATTARTPFEVLVAAARSLGAEHVARARAIAAGFASSPHDIVYKATLPLMDAITASRAGDAEEAASYGREAVDGFRGLGCPLFEAEALELSGDPDAAIEIYRRTGAVARLRRLQLAAAPETKPSHRGFDELTVREREVVELLGRGLSNAEIAERMSVSLKTVEKHLSSIYVKLGLNSRGKLMAQLFARASVAP